MLDPVTAIGLATNVADLVELSWKIVSKSHEIYKHGALPEQRDTGTVTVDLQNVNNKLLGYLHQAEKEGDLTDDDEALRRLCESSNKIATELVKRLKSVDPGSGEYRSWKSIRHALKSVWIKSELDETSNRLQAYRSQLNTRILVSLNEKVDRIGWETQNITTGINENQRLSTAIQEIQTQYLTKLITSQHEKTRGLLNGLETLNSSSRPQTSSSSDKNLQPGEQDRRLPILDAVNERNIPKLRRILRGDPQAIFVSNETGQTALHLAAGAGDVDLVAYLIRNGARINPDDDEGRVPLHYAVQSGSFAIVRALVAKGGDSLAKDAKGQAPRDLCNPSSLLHWSLSYGTNIETKNEKGYTALYQFTEQGDYEAVRTLLDENADIEAIGRSNRTPLLEATQQGHVEIVELLLSRGANVHQVDGRKTTALVAAGWHGRTRIGELLLDYSADINAANELGFTALHECCDHSHIETGLMLLQRGARTDRYHFDGCAPIHQAAWHGHHALVVAILDQGCDVNLVNTKTHLAALAYACKQGRIEMVDLLLKRGAKIEMKTEEGKTALMWAAEQGHVPVVELLLDHADKVIIDDPDNEGRTALFWAVLSRRMNTAQLLLDRGANREARDRHQYTSLIRACQSLFHEMVKLLTLAGANVHAFNNHLWSPLHEVCLRGDVGLTKLLLENGADPNSHNDAGYTPLNLAAQRRHHGAVRALLESNRANVNARNGAGWTSLAEAAHHGQLEIARSLLEYKANVNLPDNDKYTPLLRAAQSGHLSLVTCLLDEGKADINVVNKDGWSALAEASWHGFIEMVQALLARGIRRDVHSHKGQSPEDLALIKKHWQVLVLLDDKVGKRT